MSLRTRFAWPAAALLLASSTLLTPMPAHAQAASGVKVSVLHAAIYASTLTVGPDGSFFGTENFYPGTIFKVTLGRLFHRLIEFDDDNGSEASGGPLLLLPDGSFFGSTMYGGKSGAGLLFQFTPTRRYQIKHEFAGVSANPPYTNVRGVGPQQPMALASDGAIYGVTRYGGSTGNGIIFRYTTTHGVEVVHDFAVLNNLSNNPVGGLTLGPDGALYGIVQYDNQVGWFQVFRCTTTGNFSVLHTFTGTDGAFSNGAPVVGTDSALYGTTLGGGGDDAGTAYRITIDGNFTLLHEFRSSDAIRYPATAFAVGPDGRFYGKAESGPRSRGSIYRMAADGKVTVLYRSPAGAMNIDSGSNTAPVFGRDNRLYVSDSSNIYKITVPF